MPAPRADRYIRAVVEAAHQLAFRTALELIWGQVQSRLDKRMIQHSVVFAAHHEGVARQISDDGPGAVLPIQPQQSALLRKPERSEVASDGRKGQTQFLSVESVAAVANRAEPLVTVGLTDHSAGPNDFSTLASCVASSTDFLQPSKSRG
jgi:hypothetical protein